MIAVIMAGGQGTRLKEITGDLPKPMVPICDSPIIEHQLRNLKSCGVTEFIFIISKNGTAIKDYFKDGKDFNVHIKYITEEQPLGTAGALYYLKDIKEDFILAFGDLMFDIDWNRFMKFHKDNKALVSLFCHPNSHPFDSDLIVKDKDNKLIKMDSKHNIRDYYYQNVVNAGLYIVSPSAIENINEIKKIDFEKDFLNSLIITNRIFCYQSSEYCKDAGTPERYFSVTEDFKNGIIQAKNLKNPQPCIFLDRDGTINKYVGLCIKEDMFELTEEASKAIKMINKSKYLCVVITNQPGIARGDMSFDTLQNIHNKMETLLGKDGAYIDALYFCPHHPDKGFEGEVKELKIECECRKPKIGMLLKAKEMFNIDFANSFIVGDTSFDIQTGKNANIKSIQILSGAKEEKPKYDAKPDYISQNLESAVKLILGEN